ncbi:acyl carrier protein [Streptomyces sp. NRRL B-1677]|uniref:acyl carrier protein n=1 Tax=Streptomyces TaxID=1883 RepID=UPI001892C9EE|nr:acyl carrier protein [Streptomyces sp. NRRL B-1677]MBF6049568.1 acyl carrier protein [Streptomyces sp. NRRL B-1677]
MNRTDDVTDGEIISVIRRHVRVPFENHSLLAEAGLDSLSVLRIASELIPDPDQEIDPTGLAAVRTVGDLRQWLHGLLSSTAAEGLRSSVESVR